MISDKKIPEKALSGIIICLLIVLYYNAAAVVLVVSYAVAVTVGSIEVIVRICSIVFSVGVVVDLAVNL